MNTVLLDKTKIKQSFGAASTTYDSVAQLQRTVGKELLYFAGIENLSGTILDLGCGTGFLTAELLNCQPRSEAVIALDLACTMLQMARCKLSATAQETDLKKLAYLCADAELLPIADQSLDGVFSNLALQWCNSLEKVLRDIKRILKPGSPLVFSTFGPETLRELKNAWATIDSYSHVNEFYDRQQLQYLLEQAGFTDLKITAELHLSRYVSVRALMKELKQIGAHNVSSGRNRGFTTKTQMQGMITAYEQYREGDLIPSSFEVIKVVAQC
ncbi:MAG: malonyl-ACP O-methyltransferase BioC [Methylosarcina sp.]